LIPEGLKRDKEAGLSFQKGYLGELLNFGINILKNLKEGRSL